MKIYDAVLDGIVWLFKRFWGIAIMLLVYFVMAMMNISFMTGNMVMGLLAVGIAYAKSKTKISPFFILLNPCLLWLIPIYDAFQRYDETLLDLIRSFVYSIKPWHVIIIIATVLLLIVRQVVQRVNVHTVGIVSFLLLVIVSISLYSVWSESHHQRNHLYSIAFHNYADSLQNIYNGVPEWVEMDQEDLHALRIKQLRQISSNQRVLESFYSERYFQGGNSAYEFTRIYWQLASLIYNDRFSFHLGRQAFDDQQRDELLRQYARDLHSTMWDFAVNGKSGLKYRQLLEETIKDVNTKWVERLSQE